MLRLKIIGSILFLLNTFLTQAQIKSETHEFSGIDYTLIEKSKSKQAGSVSYSRTDFRISLPVALKKNKRFLFHNLNYSKTKIGYGQIPNVNTEIENFHTLGYTIAYFQPLKRDWNLTATLSPNISSNFKSGLKMKEIQIYGLLLFSKAINKKKNFILNLGLISSPSLGIFPLISGQWHPNQNWTIALGLPEFDIEYKASTKTRVGTKLFIDGDEFTFSNDAQYKNKKMDKLNILNMGTTVYLKQNISKSIHLSLDSGFTFYREFDFTRGNHKILTFDLENSLFIKAGLSVDI